MRVSRRMAGTMLLGGGLTALMGLLSPADAAQWIGGHYGPGGHWIPGHWVGPPGGPPPEAIEEPPGYRPGRYWISGHYGPGGHWFPGHWR